MYKTVITLFILGLSFGWGPCLASCGPILVSYTAGTQKNTLQSIRTYLLFCSSRILVYLLLGSLVFFLGKLVTETWLKQFWRYVFLLGGAFIICLGALTALATRGESRVCQVLQKKFLDRDQKSIALLGLILGLLPCAPLLALLSYLALVAKTWIWLVIYTFMFGLGTVLSPLLVVLGLAGLIPKLLKGQKELYHRIFSFACGLIIVILGAQLFIKGIR